jgi:hypothetical protein
VVWESVWDTVGITVATVGITEMTMPTAITTRVIMATANPMSFQMAQTAIPVTVLGAISRLIQLPGHIAGTMASDIPANSDRKK